MDCTIEEEIARLQKKNNKEIVEIVKRYVSIKLAELFSLNPTARVAWFYEQGYDDNDHYDWVSIPHVTIEGADEEDLELISVDVSCMYEESILSLVLKEATQIVATKDGVDVS